MTTCTGDHGHRDCKRATNLGAITIEQWCEHCLRRAAQAHLNGKNGSQRLRKKHQSGATSGRGDDV